MTKRHHRNYKKSKKDNVVAQEFLSSCNNSSNTSGGDDITTTDTTLKKEELLRVKKRFKFFERHKKLKVVFVVFLVLLTLLIGIGITLFAAYSCGKESMKVEPLKNDEGKVVYHNGQKYTYNEKNISFLVIGYDKKAEDAKSGRSGQADFILLVCFDTEKGTLNAISIPRDTMVEVGQFVGESYLGLDKKMQIALSYAYGDGAHTSCQNTVDSASRLLYNMPIKNYVALNLDGIGPINDSIGGVTLVPLETIPNSGIYKGQQITLLGSNAQKYVQYRDSNSVDASENRRKRQIQYSTDFFRQAVSNSSNIAATIVNLFSTALPYITTNLGFPEVTYLAQIVATKNVKNINILSLNGSVKMGQSYVEFYPDEKQLYETVLQVFYTKDGS